MFEKDVEIGFCLKEWCGWSFVSSVLLVDVWVVGMLCLINLLILFFLC